MARSLVAVLTALLLAASSGAQEHVAHDAGEFEYLISTTGVLVAAPHGTYDANTAALAIDTARRLGAGYLVFRGVGSGGLRINVNRPTEGAGRECASEIRSERAHSVYDTYLRLAHRASGGRPLSLYVEIHGNAEPRSAQNIETASKGISAAEALALKESYPAALSTVRQEWARFPALRLLVEPVDRVFFTASCVKAIGILSIDLAQRALHFELPRAAREQGLLDATSLLTSSLLKRLLPSR